MATIKVKKDDGKEVSFDAPIERFVHSRTTSIVVVHGPEIYLIYEGGGAGYYPRGSRLMHTAEWFPVPDLEPASAPEPS